MHVCSNCGSKIREYAVICPKCKAPTGIGTGSVNAIHLTTKRSLLKYLILGFLTLGIYQLVCLTNVGEDMNVIATTHDGKQTPRYWVRAVLCSFFSFLIFPIVIFLLWYDKLSDRIEEELRRRSIYYKFDSATFWGWFVAGSLILIGPLVFYAKLFKAMNLLAADYNEHGC